MRINYSFNYDAIFLYLTNSMSIFSLLKQFPPIKLRFWHAHKISFKAIELFEFTNSSIFLFTFIKCVIELFKSRI